MWNRRRSRQAVEEDPLLRKIPRGSQFSLGLGTFEPLPNPYPYVSGGKLYLQSGEVIELGKDALIASSVEVIDPDSTSPGQMEL